MRWDIEDTHLLTLYVAAITLDAKKIVELGTGIGLATEVFSDALRITGREREGMVYTIDSQPENPQVLIAKERLKDRENITFITGDSVETGRKWEDRVDIVLADSDHGYQQVLNELEVWWEKTRIMFVHDVFDFHSREEAVIQAPYYACIDFCGKYQLKFSTIRSYRCPEGIGIIK